MATYYLSECLPAPFDIGIERMRVALASLPLLETCTQDLKRGLKGKPNRGCVEITWNEAEPIRSKLFHASVFTIHE